MSCSCTRLFGLPNIRRSYLLLDIPCQVYKRMNPRQNVDRHGFSRFLRDPRAYRLDFIQYENIRRGEREYTKRKYSVEMRQKATIREKNRIQSIGREFNKLAKLLPDSNGIKRSHQKILHDTVAYIRALEVELKITDEKKLLEKWAMKKNESMKEGRNDWKSKRLSDKMITNTTKTRESFHNDDTADCGQCAGDISSNYEYITSGLYHKKHESNFVNYQGLLQQLETKTDSYCNKLREGERGKQCGKGKRNEIQIKNEVIDRYDGYGVGKGNDKWEIRRSNECVNEEMESGISRDQEEDCLSFEKIVTGFSFHL